jgi:hypothetical protein
MECILKDYYVIFERLNSQPRWWQRLTDKDFAHVYTVYADGNKTVLINMGTRYMIVEVLNKPITQFIPEIIRADASVILKYQARYSYHYLTVIRCGLNCVGITKALLNIKGLIFTPKQLYNRLRDNSQIIHEAIYG